MSHVYAAAFGFDVTSLTRSIVSGLRCIPFDVGMVFRSPVAGVFLNGLSDTYMDKRICVGNDWDSLSERICVGKHSKLFVMWRQAARGGNWLVTEAGEQRLGAADFCPGAPIHFPLSLWRGFTGLITARNISGRRRKASREAASQSRQGYKRGGRERGESANKQFPGCD